MALLFGVIRGTAAIGLALISVLGACVAILIPFQAADAIKNNQHIYAVFKQATNFTREYEVKSGRFPTDAELGSYVERIDPNSPGTSGMSVMTRNDANFPFSRPPPNGGFILTVPRGKWGPLNETYSSWSGATSLYLGQSVSDVRGTILDVGGFLFGSVLLGLGAWFLWPRRNTRQLKASAAT